MATNIVIKNARFVAFEDNELEDFLKPKRSKNTKNCTKTAATLFKRFCAETPWTSISSLLKSWTISSSDFIREQENQMMKFIKSIQCEV